jgi:hypothetical protein
MPYPTSVRLPEDVRRVLRKVAKQNRRTVTEQINFVLQEWIKRDLQPRSQDVQVGGDLPQDDRAT